MRQFFRRHSRLWGAMSRAGRGRRPSLERLECRTLLAAGPTITEFMAANATTLEDADGDWPDWVEIHNGSTEAVDLAGWTLTDNVDTPDRWEFPARMLGPDEYLVVFASGKNRAGSTGELHTNFKLSADGEYLAIVSPAGVVVAEFGPGGSDYPPQSVDVSYGVSGTGHQYFAQPTPGAPNLPGQDDLVSAPQLSVERGFYEAPFAVQITTDTPGATIHYTTDGSAPTESHGTIYAEPITISGTTTLRAAAFVEGLLGSRIETRTYIVIADVMRQSLDGQAPPGFPDPPGNVPALDYSMDPDVVFDPEWGPQLSTALTAVPSLSIATDRSNLFDSRTGIYVNPLFRGPDWERPVSVELIYPDASPGFQIDAGMRIRGGYSRTQRNPKHAFRLFFRSEYGDSKLRFPLFGDEGADQFDNIDLRTTQNYSWAFAGDSANTFLRDVFSRDVQREMGQPYTRSRYYHLYIDGLYWGLYQTQERSEASYAATYFGGGKDDYDVVKSTGSSFKYIVEATDGTLDAYHRLYQATLAGFADNEDYYRIQGMNPDGSRNANYERLLDADNLIDYMIVNYYTGDRDGPGSRFTAPKPNNFYGIFNRNAPDGFKWFEHDSEHSMDLGQQNLVTPLVTHHPDFDPADEVYFNPHWLHEALTENAEYRQRFADRVWKHFSSGGALAETAALALVNQRAAEIKDAMIAESARWGDAQRPENMGLSPLTWDDWARAVAAVRQWIPGRTETVIEQLRAVGWFPEMDAPAFSQPAGAVAMSSEIDLSAADGTIYYTIDGPDPRRIGGGIDPSAIKYDRMHKPIVLSRSTEIRARVLLAGQWSALSEAMFVVDAPRITEINYNPYEPTDAERALASNLDKNAFEFVELANTSNAPIELGGMRFTDGIAFAFADGHITSLEPGQYVLVVRDRTAFEARYGTGLPIAGEFAHGGLNSQGERIVLEDRLGNVIQSLAYAGTNPWPEMAAGRGSTLEMVDPAGDYGAPVNWRASSEYGGSPGRAGMGPAADILVNEVLSRGRDGAPDLLELHNRTDHQVDLSGWYLSNDRDDLPQTILPAGTTIGAYGYRVLDLAQLGLDLHGTHGDNVWLVESDTHGRPVRFVDHVAFAASDEAVALGRWPNGDPNGVLLPMASPSFGAANTSPQTSPVVVSEVHYHPSAGLIFEADFSAGTAADFAPILGNWAVRDQGYEGTPDAETDGDTIATIDTDGSLPPDFALSATLSAQTVDGFHQNGAIVFDYHSPTDFKFAAMFAKGNKWRIGQRNEAGWNFLREVKVPAGIEADTAIDVRVEIRGSSVILHAPEVRLVYDFGTPLGNGLLGVGSKNGTPRFTHLKVEWIGVPEDLQFLELANSTAAPVDLEGWRVARAVDLRFAPGTTLAPGATVVVVGFDPSDENKVAAFRAVFGAPESLVLAGPYRGTLSDEDGVVRLVRPVTSGTRDSGLALMDRAAYDNRPPWPLQADGGGGSLHRTRADSAGSLPGGWRAAAPSPGAVEFVRAGDLNLDGTVGVDDVSGLVTAIADALVYETIYGVPAAVAGDVDGDGDVDLDDIDDFVALLGRVEPAVAERPLPAGQTPALFSVSAAVRDRRDRKSTTRAEPPAATVRGTRVLPAERRSAPRRRAPRLAPAAHSARPPVGQHNQAGRRSRGPADRAVTETSWRMLADRALATEPQWRRFRCPWPFAPRTCAFSRSEKPRTCQPCSVKVLNGVALGGEGLR